MVKRQKCKTSAVKLDETTCRACVLTDVFLRKYHTLALTGRTRSVDDCRRSILVGFVPFNGLHGFDHSTQLGHSNRLKTGDNAADLLRNIVIILGINQGAALAFLQKLSNVGRGKFFINRNDDVVTAHDGKISENPLVAVLTDHGYLVACAIGFIEIRCELLHVIVKLIVCNGGFAFATLGAKKYLVAVLALYESEKLFKGFIKRYDVMGERFIFHCFYSFQVIHP